MCPSPGVGHSLCERHTMRGASVKDSTRQEKKMGKWESQRAPSLWCGSRVLSSGPPRWGTGTSADIVYMLIVHVCVYIYIYIYTHISLFIYSFIDLFIHLCIQCIVYVCICIIICIHTYVYTYTYTYIQCTYIHIHIHILIILVPQRRQVSSWPRCEHACNNKNE